MGDGREKIEKKRAKAAVKLAKSRANGPRSVTDPATDRGAFQNGVVRFLREGLFQTIVKVAAGLIVGYLLLRFGLR